MATDDDTCVPAAHPSPEFAAIAQELVALSGKLALAAEHWTPFSTSPDDLGAVVTIHDVARALDRLYCVLSDFGHTHDLLVSGPLAGSFKEAWKAYEALQP